MNTKAVRAYSHRTIQSSFFSILPALFIAALIPSLGGMINGSIVGNEFTANEMAAISFASPTGSIFNAIAVAFSVGAGILYGRSLGRGESEELHQIFTADVGAILGVGILFTLIGELFTPSVAKLLGADGASFSPTVDYLRGIFIGLIPWIMLPSLISFLNLGNEARYGMLSSIVLVGGNLLLGLFNVKVLHMGMFGLGLACSESQYLAALFLIFRFLKRKELGHLVKCDKFFLLAGKILGFGLAASLHEVFVGIRSTAINTMTFASGGTAAVAGFGVYSLTCGLFCSLLGAVSTATSTLISIAVGEEDRTYLTNLVRQLLKMCLVIFLADGLLFSLCAPLMALFCGMTGEAYDYAIWAIRIGCLEFLASWAMVVFQAVYQTLGRVFYSILLQFLINIVYALGASFLLSVPFGPYGVWMGVAAGCYLGVFTFFFTAWIKNKRFPKSVADWLWLDSSFGVPDEDRIAISVDSMEDVLQVSRAVQAFCDEKGIDRKRGMMTALCLEELAENMFDNLHESGESRRETGAPDKQKTDMTDRHETGAPDKQKTDMTDHRETGAPEERQTVFRKRKNKKLAIDISVAVKDNTVKIRMRDNAPKMDPFTKLSQYNSKEDDPAKDLGIRIVSKLAKEMHYQPTLGMNVLMIEI